MAEFNSMDTAAFKGVWVFCEQREGQIQTISYQLLSEGRKLANDLGVELCGVVMGSDLNENYVKALGGYGADRVYYIDSPLLKDYTTDGYAKALCDLVMEKKPEIVLIGATNLGRDLGPRCAARLHTGLTADCTHLDVDVEKYKAFLQYHLHHRRGQHQVRGEHQPEDDPSGLRRSPDGHHHLPPVPSPDVHRASRRDADPALRRGRRRQGRGGEDRSGPDRRGHPRGGRGGREEPPRRWWI